jgi:hypothetical protein
VAHAHLFVPQGGLDAGRQAEQAEEVGDRRAALAHPLGHFFLRQVALLHETLVPEGNLEGIELLALHVLDEGHLEHLLRVGLADERGQVLHAGAAGCSQAPLAGNDLKLAVSEGPHRNGLDEAHLIDGGGKLIERLVLELLARLVRVRADAVHRHLSDAAEQAGAVLELVELALPLRLGVAPVRATLLVRRLLVLLLRQERVEAFAKC